MAKNREERRKALAKLIEDELFSPGGGLDKIRHLAAEGDLPATRFLLDLIQDEWMTQVSGKRGPAPHQRTLIEDAKKLRAQLPTFDLGQRTTPTGPEGSAEASATVGE